MEIKHLNQTQLELWVNLAKTHVNHGKLPDYIPELALADPGSFACAVQRVNGDIVQVGDVNLTFPLMSVIKPFLLLFLLEKLGAKKVFLLVGKEPSNLPFNSIEQLNLDGNFPRNPMINSGAIALSSLLESYQELLIWLNKTAQSNLFLDEKMLTSVRSLPNARNRLIAQTLEQAELLQTTANLALVNYESICCLSGKITDLAKLGILLVGKHGLIQPENSQIVQKIMTSCGLYEKSAEFAQDVGLPSKSGVSGALLSIIPDIGSIACYSPPLDQTGNSVYGMLILKYLRSFLTECL